MNTFTIAGQTIAPGERVQFNLPGAALYTNTPLDMPVEVIHGRRPGPTLLVCAGVHGNELNGVEIIRRLRTLPTLNRLKGTLILVPVVNLHGFINRSRYLPDRRDLNRCFPGSESGSLGSRVAYLFFNEIASRATHIVDLHTAAVHRENLPQIRADLENPVIRELALSFSIPVIVHSRIIEKSLRSEAGNQGIAVITYEAGEGLRLSETAIVTGVRGIISTMRNIGMLTKSRSKKSINPNIAYGSKWFRAESDGLFRPLVELGSRVKEGDTLGVVSSPFSSDDVPILCSVDGIVIGQNKHPLVNEGEALFNVGIFKRAAAVEEDISSHEEDILSDPLYEPEQVDDVDL